MFKYLGLGVIGLVKNFVCFILVEEWGFGLVSVDGNGGFFLVRIGDGW